MGGALSRETQIKGERPAEVDAATEREQMMKGEEKGGREK